MHVIDNNTFSEIGSKSIQMIDPGGQICKAKGLNKGH